MPKTVIELKVRNHAGVMSQITGLFSRRAYNLEGILCGPLGDGTQSRMYLLVQKDHRIDLIIKNLEKLYDVFEVAFSENYDHTLFARLDEFTQGTMAQTSISSPSL